MEPKIPGTDVLIRAKTLRFGAKQKPRPEGVSPAPSPCAGCRRRERCEDAASDQSQWNGMSAAGESGRVIVEEHFGF
jgi:hypothetical protein